MSEWPLLELVNYPVEIIDGDRSTEYPKTADFTPSGYCLFLNAGNVTTNGFAFSQCAFISAERDQRLRKGRLQRDDIVATTRGTVGNFAFYDATVAYANVRINSGMVILRPNPKKLLPRFFYFAVRSPLFTTQIRSFASGSAQPQLPIRDIRKLRLPLPPVEEQARIVEVIGSLDDKIELNGRMNETLEAMAQAIFRDWFVDFGPTRRKLDGATAPVEIMGGLIADPDRAQELAALFPASIGENGLPEGWKEGTLGDIARAVGTAVSPSQIVPDTPYIGLEHMPRRSIALGEWEAASKVSSNKTAFRRGQILFGKLRPYFHKVGIAPVDGVCSTDIVVLDASDQPARSMIAACVSTDEFVAFTDQGSTGTKMPRTSWGNMKKYRMALATDAVVQSYSAIASPLMDKIVAAIHENRTLAATRDVLLPKLMSGEIRSRDVEAALEAAQ